jgi:hypothetical protein
MKKVGMPKRVKRVETLFFWTVAAVGIEGRKGDPFGGRLRICRRVSRPSTAGSQRPRSSAGWGDHLDAAPARLGPGLIVAKPGDPTRWRSAKCHVREIVPNISAQPVSCCSGVGACRGVVGRWAQLEKEPMASLSVYARALREALDSTRFSEACLQKGLRRLRVCATRNASSVDCWGAARSRLITCGGWRPRTFKPIVTHPDIRCAK